MHATDHPGVWIVRTDLDHLLIYAGNPRQDRRLGWPRPGQRFRTEDGRRGRCIERFCEIAVKLMGWHTIPRNVPTLVLPQ